MQSIIEYITFKDKNLFVNVNNAFKDVIVLINLYFIFITINKNYRIEYYVLY